MSTREGATAEKMKIKTKVKLFSKTCFIKKT